MSYVMVALIAFLLGVAFERWLNRTDVYDHHDDFKPGGTA